MFTTFAFFLLVVVIWLKRNKIKNGHFFNKKK